MVQRDPANRMVGLYYAEICLGHFSGGIRRHLPLVRYRSGARYYAPRLKKAEEEFFTRGLGARVIMERSEKEVSYKMNGVL